MAVEESRLRERVEQETDDEHYNGKDDANKGAFDCGFAIIELTGENLDAVLEVDPGDVESKGVARE